MIRSVVVFSVYDMLLQIPLGLLHNEGLLPFVSQSTIPAVRVHATPFRTGEEDNVVCFVCKEETETNGRKDRQI